MSKRFMSGFYEKCNVEHYKTTHINQMGAHGRYFFVHNFRSCNLYFILPLSKKQEFSRKTPKITLFTV